MTSDVPRAREPQLASRPEGPDWTPRRSRLHSFPRAQNDPAAEMQAPPQTSYSATAWWRRKCIVACVVVTFAVSVLNKINCKIRAARWGRAQHGLKPLKQPNARPALGWIPHQEPIKEAEQRITLEIANIRQRIEPE